MLNVNIILRYYIFLTLFIAFSPLKMQFMQALPGLLLMWILYLLFIFADLKNKIKIDINKIETEFINIDKPIVIFLFTCLITAIVPSYIEFYTGSSVATNLQNYFSGISTYKEYQTYFMQQNLRVFSIIKIPYILFGGIQKFFFATLAIRTFCFKKFITKWDFFSIFLLGTNYILIAISRGTFFELFELFILAIYVLILKQFRFYNKDKLSKKTIIILIFIFFILTVLFSYNLQQRGSGEASPIQALQPDPDSYFAQLFPAAAILASGLGGYFMFGIYFTSLCVANIWFSSLDAFMSLFFPSGLSLFDISDGYAPLICDVYTNCGSAWRADTIMLIQNYSIIFLFGLVFLIGFNSKRLVVLCKKNSIPAAVLLYYSFIFMMSLPVGNFISTSSYNVLAILFAIFFLYFPRVPFFLKV